MSITMKHMVYRRIENLKGNGMNELDLILLKVMYLSDECGGVGTDEWVWWGGVWWGGVGWRGVGGVGGVGTEEWGGVDTDEGGGVGWGGALKSGVGWGGVGWARALIRADKCKSGVITTLMYFMPQNS